MKRLVTSILPGLLILLLAAPAAQAVQNLKSSAVPAGTKIQVRMIDKLDTGVTRPGETFKGTVAEPVVVNGQTVLGRGQAVSGRVVQVISSGRLQKPASITLELTSIATQPLRLDAKSHTVRNAEYIGGGAAAGALLGALVGGKKGAAIGAGVGAGAGTAGAYMTGKKEIVIPSETLLTFETGAAAASTSASRTPTTSKQLASGRQPAYSSASAGEPVAGGDPRERNRSVGGVTLPTFSPRDQQIIRDYYAQSYSNLPPGLAKRGGNLPPGLERQLQRNGTLPPGLQKRVEPFPAALEQRLPPLPTGYSRVVLAGKAMILDRNNKILDLFAYIAR